MKKQATFTFLDHKMELIEHPGNENGYLYLPDTPGEICGWLPKTQKVYMCSVCKLIVSDAGEEEPGKIRIPEGALTTDFLEESPKWKKYWSCTKKD